jgi:two-component system C4-dicarboxylate transport response regulator DctD
VTCGQNREICEGSREKIMRPSILIVDDEELMASSLQLSLSLDIPGSRVDAAHSGEEGLSHLAQRSYDLLIADMRMPGFDGLRLIEGVRYLDHHIPIVLMTGYGSASIKAEARRLGVNHYFDKPFDVVELISVVRQLLPRTARTSA